MKSCGYFMAPGDGLRALMIEEGLGKWGRAKLISRCCTKPRLADVGPESYWNLRLTGMLFFGASG